jgi:hypothetical protein
MRDNQFIDRLAWTLTAFIVAMLLVLLAIHSGVI